MPNKAEAQLNKAVRLVQGQDLLTGELKRDSKVNRAEAAWLNRQVALQFRRIGLVKEADNREMLARFYEVDEDERKPFLTYPLGEIDRRNKSEMPYVRPVSEAQTKRVLLS